jgi:hypothetical protein
LYCVAALRAPPLRTLETLEQVVVLTAPWEQATRVATLASRAAGWHRFVAYGFTGAPPREFASIFLFGFLLKRV